MSLEHARTIADAVLYEGYLLYPYRSTSSKNQSRWQWGVLGPPGAATSGTGEESVLSTQCLVRPAGDAHASILLRFLQLQARVVEAPDGQDSELFHPVQELHAADCTWLSWDEAVAHEIELGTFRVEDSREGQTLPVRVDGGEDVELLTDDDGHTVGRVVRRRWPLSASVRVTAAPVGGLTQLSVHVENDAAGEEWGKASAIRRSFIGTHLILTASAAEFVSLLEPPDDAREAVAACEQRRCWPVLTGPEGRTDIMLASPIILYDYPEVAEQSAGALFDSTEIDEILTLRVMTLTDDEKAAARATDPRAAEIIDRCEQMSPQDMAGLHGVLRDPHAGLDAASMLDVEGPRDLPDMSDLPTFTDVRVSAGPRDVRDLEEPTFDTGDSPWWDPAADASVSPETDGAFIEGVLISKDSLVRIRPSRRADAQDIFFAGETARVTAVLSDVDGQVHIAVVLVDDPAADMHEWYGRYLYFGPEELEPLDPPSGHVASDHGDRREESRS
ncbi:MAG: hypothetical protein ACR2JU_09465 [Nocardioidaceae bacterium]